MMMDYTYSTSTLLGVVDTKLPYYERLINGHAVDYHITHDPNVGTHTIVAKIHDDCQNDVLQDVEHDPSTFFMLHTWNRRLDKCRMSKHPMARAVCDPRDEYDEEYGKALAYDRLKVAYWSQYEDRLGKFNDLLTEEFDKNSRQMTKISERYLQGED